MSEDQEQETPNVKQMRETINRLKAENAELQGFRVQTVFEQSGLDPTTGIGKAVAKDIERGDYDGEFTADALAAFATDSYGWAPPEGTTTPQPQTAEQVAAEGQGRLDKLAQHQTPPPVPDDLEATQSKAQAEGDHLASIQAGVASLLGGNS